MPHIIFVGHCSVEVADRMGDLFALRPIGQHTMAFQSKKLSGVSYVQQLWRDFHGHRCSAIDAAGPLIDWHVFRGRQRIG